jgi:hypothetical protein
MNIHKIEPPPTGWCWNEAKCAKAGQNSEWKKQKINSIASKKKYRKPEANWKNEQKKCHG